MRQNSSSTRQIQDPYQQLILEVEMPFGVIRQPLQLVAQALTDFVNFKRRINFPVTALCQIDLRLLLLKACSYRNISHRYTGFKQPQFCFELVDLLKHFEPGELLRAQSILGLHLLWDLQWVFLT
jgi:hypothetical protein